MLNFNIYLTGVVQSHDDKLIEDLIKRAERKRREESRKNDLNSKINGDTFAEYGDYEIRM